MLFDDEDVNPETQHGNEKKKNTQPDRTVYIDSNSDGQKRFSRI